MARMVVRLALQHQVTKFEFSRKRWYVDDSMTSCTFRKNVVFLVTMKLATLMVTHMITVVQTAAQLVLEMKRKIVRFIDIVHI